MISGLLTPAGGDSLDDADDCFHAFDGHVFEGTVVAVAARAEIWAGESHKAEFGAVGAAAHRVAYRRDVFGGDGGAGAFKDFGRFFDDLQHVAVGMLELELDRAFAEFFVKLFGDFAQEFLAFFKSRLVVVADDVAECRFGHVALHVGQVVEPFAAFGGGGCFVFGERHRNFDGHEACVFHDALGFAGMHALAVNLEGGTCGVEVFVSDVAFVSAVDGVGVFSREIAQVQTVGAASDFFVWSEADPDVSVA